MLMQPPGLRIISDTKFTKRWLRQYSLPATPGRRIRRRDELRIERRTHPQREATVQVNIGERETPDVYLQTPRCFCRHIAANASVPISSQAVEGDAIRLAVFG
jgi:hypothetical protein